MDKASILPKRLFSFILCGTVVLTLALMWRCKVNTQQHFQHSDLFLSYKRYNSKTPFISKENNYTGGYDNVLTWKRFMFETKKQGKILTHAIYFTNAVYDVREESVRIDVIESRRGAKLLQMQCRLYQSSVDHNPVDVSAKRALKKVWKLTGPIDGVWYDTMRYSCRVPNPNIHYQYISLVASCQCDSNDTSSPQRNASFYLGMQEWVIKNGRAEISYRFAISYPPAPATHEHEFGICVSVSHGLLTDNNVHGLIEWFEFYKMFGVTEINIYNGTLWMEPRSKRVLKHYIESGLLKLHDLNPPMSFKRSEEYFASMSTRVVSLHDCLYRALNRYRFMIVVDLDEIIIPYKHKNYHDLMMFIQKKHHVDLMKKNPNFVSKYFYRVLPRYKIESELSVTLQYRNFVDLRFTPKSIYNPRACHELNVHWCGPRPRWTVPVNLGMVHHTDTTVKT